jgi:hypothetical protein
VTTPDEATAPTGYRHGEDACLDRTAAALDFGDATPDEQAAAAARHVDPFRSILGELLRSVRARRR